MNNSSHLQGCCRQIAVYSVLLVALYMLGCATASEERGAGFSPETAGGISNLLSATGALAPAIAPSPWGQIIQTVSFLLLALLTAWQTWTHKIVHEIKSVVTPTKKEQTP
jgi:hypothetical protein